MNTSGEIRGKKNYDRLRPTEGDLKSRQKEPTVKKGEREKKRKSI